MSCAANIMGPWVLEAMDCSADYRTMDDIVKDENGDPVMVKVKGWVDGEEQEFDVPKRIVRYEKREHYVMQQSRQLVQISSFSEDVGETTSGFTWTVGAGPNGPIQLSYVSASKTWTCSRDALKKDTMEVATYQQEQTWEWYSAWVKVDPSAFA